MRDEDLEVLVTLDDPSYGPDEDIFNHLQPITEWPRSFVSNNANAGTQEVIPSTSRESINE